MRSLWRRTPRRGGADGSGIFTLGVGAPEAKAIGWKAAMLHRLQAGGAAVAEGVVIEADVAAQMAEEPVERWSAELRAQAEAALAALRSAGARETVLRLSPDAPISGLDADTELSLDADALPRFAAAVTECLETWLSPRSRRRRLAAQISERCAVLAQRRLPLVRRVSRLRLHDPETGAPTPSGWIAAPGEDGAALDPQAPEAEAALALAQRCEAILGAPLELEIGFTAGRKGGQPYVLRAQPLRAPTTVFLRIVARMVAADAISREDALLAIDPLSLEELLHSTIDPQAERDSVVRGLPASPGAVAGRLAFTAEAAEKLARDGQAAILARPETSPEDVHGVHAAAGVLTTRGGLTSHAAVVARGLGRPCVVGAVDARIDVEAQTLTVADGRVFRAGDVLTLDGSGGEVLAGEAPLRQPEPAGALARLMEWADGERRLSVRANADTPEEVETAGRLGVDGVGLCRTEHMFFEPRRINAMREMILADGETERRAALERLLPMQREDFVKLLEIAGRAVTPRGGLGAPPVTIRLLDPPLHEFLPQDQRGLEAVAEAMGETVEKLTARARELREFNPILGKRGCRLGVAFPEIYEMQARAIFEAAIEVERVTGQAPALEIMIALVSATRELEMLKNRIDAVAATVAAEQNAPLHYGVGVMIETPRAALRAGALAPISTFFSFGTNDLTQMTYGLSRDDAGRLMRDYVEREVFEADPFENLDQEGVGELIGIAVERGRAANPALEIGVCGEHGGHPDTIAFCEAAGLDFVSCSPFRAPIARLAAAQAAIRARRASSGGG